METITGYFRLLVTAIFLSGIVIACNDHSVYIKADINSVAYSQVNLNNHYGATIETMIAHPDGGVVIGVHGLFGSDENHNSSVIRLDRDAKVIWKHHFYDTRVNFFFQINLVNNEIHVTRAVLNKSDLHGEISLVAFSSAGDVLYERVLFDDGMVDAPYLNIYNNGEYIFIGARNDKQNRFQSRVSLVDSTGKLLWQKNHELSKDSEYFQGLVQRSEKSMYVVGDQFNEQTYSTFHGFVIELDNNGKIVNELYHGQHNSSFNGIIDVGDGLILTGALYSVSSEPHAALVTKIDYDGNKLWQKTIQDDNSDRVVVNLKKLDDGIILFVRSSNSRFFGEGSSEVIDENEIHKLGFDGHQVWTYKSNNTNNIKPGLAVATQSNDLLIAGSAKSEHAFPVMFLLDGQTGQMIEGDITHIK